LLSPADKRVGIPLDADRCRRTVPGKDFDVVPKGKEFCTDSGKEQFTVAAWEIPSAHAAGKEDITPEKNARVFGEETKRAGAVTGHEQNFAVEPADGKGFCLVQFLKRFQGQGIDVPPKTELPEEIALGHHWNRLRMTNHGACMPLMDLCCIPRVIDVAVCEQEMPHRIVVRGQPIGGILRGIDEDSAGGKVEAIGVENTTGKGLNLHVGSVFGLSRDKKSKIF